MTISRNLSFFAEGVSSTGVLGATYGGTGQSSITTGDLLYGSASNTISKLAIGSTGTILRVVAGVPSWGTDYTGTVTSVAALTLGTTGTDLSSTVANGTTTPVITLNVPTASATNRGALSAADWSTFNGKAPGVTFTTGYVPFGQGTTTLNQSSAFTYSSSTLTVPSIIAQSGGALGGAFAVGGSYAYPVFTAISGSSANIRFDSTANSGGKYWRLGDVGTFGGFSIYDETDNTFPLTAFSSGGVLVGGYTPDPGANNLSVTGQILVGTTTANGKARIQTANNEFSGLFEATNASYSSEVVTIRPSRNTTNGSFYALSYYNNGAGAYKFYVIDSGAIYSTSIVITSISDERLKENIRDIDTGIDAIMAIKPRRFDWKEGKGQDKKNAAGFIAQEFEQVFPNSVSTSKAGEDGIEYMTMNHEELIPTLVKAIQEQQAIIEQLKEKVGL